MKGFKKGDKVRVIIEDWQQNFDMGNDLGTICTGDVGVVAGPSWDGEDVEVVFYGLVRLDFAEDEIELVESYDPKTAFLTELQSLLRMYDAKIYVWAGEDGDMSLTFGLKDNIDIRYPNEWCTDYKFEFPITPDNIFNYDKE